MTNSRGKMSPKEQRNRIEQKLCTPVFEKEVKPKSCNITLESDNPKMVIEFTDIDQYKVPDICHNLVNLCENLRINSNTLTVVEETESEKDTL